jgi:probable phosphoglycerate mutase
MKQAPELWLVRHGETEWSRDGRHTGRSDIPLSARGRARQLAPLLADRPFDQVWCSPLARARETAALAGFGARAEYLDDLCEWDYGEYEGRTTDEIRLTQPGFSTWTAPITAGESLTRVAERAGRVLEQAVATGGCSLLFAHAHLLRILAAGWLGLDPAAGRLLALDAASLSVLGHEHETRVIRLWNWTAQWPSPPLAARMPQKPDRELPRLLRPAFRCAPAPL